MLMNQGPVTNFWNSLKEADLIFFNIDVIPFIARGFRQFEISIFDYINYSPATPERYVDSNHAYYVATWVLTTVCFGLLTICITLAVFLKRASLKRVYSTKHLDDYS